MSCGLKLITRKLARMKRCNVSIFQKIALVTALFMVPSITQAQTTYIGLGAASASYKPYGDGYHTEPMRLVYVGQKFSRFFALEGEYAFLNSSNNTEGEYVDSATFWSLSMINAYPLTDNGRFVVFSRLGVTNMKAEQDSSTERTTSATFGIGMDLNLTRSWGMRLAINSYEFAPHFSSQNYSTTRLIARSLSVRYSF